MTRLGSLLGVLAAVLLLTAFAVAVLAQSAEVPPPYAGLKNPFPWDDTSAQAAGKQEYQRCAFCHGATGNNISSAKFSTAAYSRGLQERPDYYFWVVSEGRMDKGMPPFKSSLSNEQRWQLLTYIWSLGASSAQPGKPAIGASGILSLTAPAQAQSGQPLTLTATLQDLQGKPIGSAAVKFFIRVDFFGTGVAEIGEAMTDMNGVAKLEYIPREAGETQMIARYEAVEASATVSLAGAPTRFYHVEVGLQNVPGQGKEVFIGDITLGENGEAPRPVLRLPTGRLSWLSPLLFSVVTIWVIYFYVYYQVFSISGARKTGVIDTRLVPLAGMAVVLMLGIVLILKLITGPYSHLHVLP
ncbi:MAG: c-type cytochrome [Dehalococcoidia bacterium]|nr:c-type cytochrome [Dehalococcoidia bacterium]